MLEKDVVPLFYQRGPDGMPRVWISRMKKSMRALAPAGGPAHQATPRDENDRDA